MSNITQPPKGLTANSIITLHDALEDLDNEFADGTVPDGPAVALLFKPRRSVHAQIIDLRLLGDCTWQEIANYLDTPLTSVYRMGLVATEFLRTKLKDVFAVFEELQPPQAPQPASTAEPARPGPEG